MKNLIIFAIWDKIAGRYSLPLVQINKAMAERYFDNVIKNGDNMTEPTDFELYILGEYNQETGEIINKEKPEFVKKGFVEELPVKEVEVIDNE